MNGTGEGQRPPTKDYTDYTDETKGQIHMDSCPGKLLVLSFFFIRVIRVIRGLFFPDDLRLRFRKAWEWIRQNQPGINGAPPEPVPAEIDPLHEAPESAGHR
jgi:hypothetical protein